MRLPDLFKLADQWKVHALQIDPVHIPALDGSAYAQFKDLVHNFDFEIILGSVESLMAWGPAAAHAVERYQKYIDACRGVDAHVLRSVCGADRYLKDPPLAEQVAIVEENLTTLVPYAADAGVTVAIENHGTLASQEVVDIVTGVNSPFVKINLDNGNSLLTFEDPVEAFRVMAPYAACLHFKDYRKTQTGYGMVVEGCALGKGVIDLSTQLAIYKKLCPEAKICLEIPLKRGNEKQAVAHSLEVLRNLLNSAD